MAIQQCLPLPTKKIAQIPTVPNEDGPAKLKKCKHCCKSVNGAQVPSNEQDPSDREGCEQDNRDTPSCPCCPDDPKQKSCPCPGGCALCSVAKTPLLLPLDLDLHQALCVGNCVSIDLFEYISPMCDGLDRPPRV
jgi:hypothetical protein